MTTRKSLAALQQKIKEDKEKQENRGKGKGFVGDYYPFYKMDFGQECVIRILFDGDDENQNQFYVDKFTHQLLFGPNKEKRTINCLANWGEECPICDVSRKHYDAAGKGNPSPEGKYFYKKRNTLIRALVVKDPLPPGPDGSTQVGKVVTLNISKDILARILAGFAEMEPEDPHPLDMDHGFDFVIRKTKNGEFADYNQSGFARKSSAIAEKLQKEIKLIDLRTLFGKNPGIEQVCAFLEAHDNGQEWNGGKTAEAKVPYPTKDSAETKSDTTKQAAKTESVAETTSSADGEETDEETEELMKRIQAHRNSTRG